MAPYRLDVVSLAPQAFAPLPDLGVIGRAFGAGIAELHLHNPRDFATDRYRKADDVPYGGGAGMVFARSLLSSSDNFALDASLSSRRAFVASSCDWSAWKSESVMRGVAFMVACAWPERA